MIIKDKRGPRDKRHYRLRRWVRGTAARPRLAVFRSLNHIYAQVVDDDSGRTLVAADSLPEREGGWVEIYAHEPFISPRMFLAITCSMSGDQRGAAELLAEVLALARGAHPYVETFSLFFAAWLAMLNRDPVKADQHATRAAELARSSGFPLAEGLGSAIRGWALSQQHDRDAGLAILVESISRVRATGARMLDAFLMALLAEAQIAVGRSDEALATTWKT